MLLVHINTILVKLVKVSSLKQLPLELYYHTVANRIPEILLIRMLLLFFLNTLGKRWFIFNHSKMGYEKFVEIGRVAFVSAGPSKGKLAVIVDVLDQNRYLIYFFY